VLFFTNGSNGESEVVAVFHRQYIIKKRHMFRNCEEIFTVWRR